MAVKFVKGFTLIESVIAMVIISLAIVMLTMLFYPQIISSARPAYEVRASALARSLMSEMLARNFDELSDSDGGIYRCGELDRNGQPTTCTDEENFGPDNSEPPALFNDVDDYIGCWYTTSESQSACVSSEAGSLSDIFGNDIEDEYRGFRAEVDVNYDNDNRLTAGQSQVFKMITVVITAGQYGDFTFVAHKGNY